MPHEYLLDTSIAVFLFRDHPRVRERMAQVRPALLPFVTAAELLYGAKRSARALHNLREYSAFVSRFTVLFPGRSTLEVQTDLRISLDEIGKPIPQNDLWQAAIAVQHDAILVTNDSHFAAIPGLRLEDWTK